MPSYQAPVEHYVKLLRLFGFQDARYDDDLIRALLDNVGAFARDALLPQNALGDHQGCVYDQETKSVRLPDGFKELYRQYVAQGYHAISAPEIYGGQELPPVLTLAMVEFVAATNMAFSLGPMLTPAACQAIMHAGTEEQKAYYLPKMVTGEWSGTMCLTEAHCGTDLGLIKTRAVPNENGFSITGNKIWITYGEHDLTDNIIHLVLAKLPDAPAGSHGISMFIVPKFLPDGTRNQVYCTGLEKKLGQHASPTCFMSFDNAQGFLLGAANKGMQNMFVMMNEARVGVGVSGLAMAEIAYQTAVGFCRERRQSRAVDASKRDSSQPADCILVHPDVRRQLLEVKSTNLPMRALVVYVGVMMGSDDPADQARVSLLTPLVKSYLSERGCDNISHCMQVLGGAGYVKDWHIEQYYRDARISMIYEGTNGIQALDLVGRKLVKDGGAALRALLQDMRKLAEACEDGVFSEALLGVVADVEVASKWLMVHGMQDPEQACAVASAYLQLLSYAVLAMMWVKMLQISGEDERAAGLYYIHHVLPDAKRCLALVHCGKQYITGPKADDF
jgi:alkylation response protein AidB-like acyl-CoA dehydrogenase